MTTKNLDQIMKGTGSRVMFHTEIFDKKLNYGRGHRANGTTNIRDEIKNQDMYFGGWQAGPFVFHEGVPLTSIPRPGITSTPELIRKFTGTYKHTVLVHEGLLNVFAGSYDGMDPSLLRQIRSESGLDLVKDLVLLVNSHQPAQWYIQTGVAEPVTRDQQYTGEVRNFFGRLTKKRMTKKVITRVNRKYDTENVPAYSDEIVNTEASEPLYINEVGIFLPSMGRNQGASKSRFMLFQFYTPESADQMIQGAGGNPEQRDLLLNIFEKNFPDVYQESQACLAVANTSLEQLPALQYTPSNKQLSKI
ncbi:MAG: hypothetical protein IH934_00720 [Nanoarchaeota archaeon]|nr:hypothetical protein [Nanoarchaeota archaeon]